MQKQDFNHGWKLREGIHNAYTTIVGFGGEEYDVLLPHDAMIASARNPNSVLGASGGYFTPSNVEYVKSYTPALSQKGQTTLLEFEGVYMNASVQVNDDTVCQYPFGYSDFIVDISDYLVYGKENQIKVMVKNANQPNSRWYTGTGIYRDVKLAVAPAMHIALDGTRVTTVEASEELAVISIDTTIENKGAGFHSGWLITTIRDTKGAVSAELRAKYSVTSNSETAVHQRVTICEPALWNVDAPNLYTCESELMEDGTVVDRATTSFGIRKLQLDSVYGLRINGVPIKLKGGCIHHDNGILGAASFADAEDRKVRKMREAGYNALRSSHHPMGRALLDACDKYGMLVMDEFTDAWTLSKQDYDCTMFLPDRWEEDIANMVRKNYNHPCVIMYSTGNEIPETGSAHAASWGRKFSEKIRELDSTRYITNGINVMVSSSGKFVRLLSAAMGIDVEEQNMNINDIMNLLGTNRGKITALPEVGEILAETCSNLDIVGYNYATERYEADHAMFPERIFVGSETNPPDLDKNWDMVMENPYLLGDFSWTAWDYLGEAGLGRIVERRGGESFVAPYPWSIAYCADFDITGFRRPVSYWRETIWNGRNHQPYISVHRPNRVDKDLFASRWSWTDSLHSWTWPGMEGRKTFVEIYTDADEAELFVNGVSLGRKTVGDDFKQYYCRWETAYVPGKLEAVTYVDGREVGHGELGSAGRPELSVSLSRQTLRAGSNDLCFVEIELRDENGTLHMAADREISLEISGAALLVASGSADPCTEECYSDRVHRTFEGRLLAVIRAGESIGECMLTVSGEDVETKVVKLQVVESKTCIR